MPGEFMAIGENSFDQILTKRLVGPGGSLAPAVAPEMFPVITLESDRPEWQYLFGGRRSSASANQAAVVGNQSLIRLRNPVGSQCLAVVELIELFVGVTTTVEFIRSVDLADLAVVAVTATTDLRVFQDPVAGGSGGQLVLSNDAPAVSPILNPTTLYRMFGVPANLRELLVYPFILAPGTQITLRAAAANVQMAANITWRERYLNPTER